LDKVLHKWIPEHKIEKVSVEKDFINILEPLPENKAPSSPVFNLVIEGVNTVKGYENSGSDDEGCRYMLDSFCKDSGKKINMLRHILHYFKTVQNFDAASENTISILETILKIIKNSVSSIGAEAIAFEAAALEEQLRAGDLNSVVSKLPDFYHNLSIISERIQEAINSVKNA
jgi:hypothetical protein